MKLVKTKHGTYSIKGLNIDDLIALYNPLDDRGGIRSDEQEKLYILIGAELETIGCFSDT